MSLQSIYLDELNAMAKKRDPSFAAKLREVMVDRHPATLAPDEYDPVATVALAWEEVALRGRPAFEGFAEETIDHMEQAWVLADPGACDWPLAHAVCRLLRMVPAKIIDPGLRSRCVRKLAGLVADRPDFLALSVGRHPAPNTLWTDAFRLYLAWHTHEPVWLETLWHAALKDANWTPDEGACLFLEDAAASHLDFVTLPRLVEFWQAVHQRGAEVGDLRRWFYIVGAILENTIQGQGRLDEILDGFGNHLQNIREKATNLPWDLYVEAVATMFRNPVKRQRVLDFKSPRLKLVPKEAINSAYRIPAETISRELTASLRRAA